MSATDENQNIPLDHICSLCQSIFVGPLSFRDSPKLPKELSIHINCWDCWAPQPNVISRLWNTAGAWFKPLSSRLFSATAGTTTSDISSTISTDPYLPNELRMDNHKFIHMARYFEPHDENLDDIAAAEAETMPRIPVFTKVEKPLIRPWKRYGTHHQTAASFLESVGDKCHICSEIRESVSNSSDKDLENARAYESGFTTYGLYYFPSFKSCRVVFHLGFTIDPKTQFVVRGPVLDLHYRPHQVLHVPPRVKSDISESIGLAGVVDFQLISSWLDECDNTHDCGLPISETETPFMPTRVLVMGEDDATSIKLLITKEAQINAAYGTLSYCWGTSGVPLKLLSHLLPEFQEQGIPLVTLPRTLRESIQITREIGLKYIWIDSLCIVQDSADDWNLEAAKMADIYSNSYVNLAATDSRDCNDGLVSMPQESHGYNERAHQGLINVESYWLSEGYQRLQLLDFDVFPRNVNNAPLNQRGWVLQERYLAPRTIHFGRHQLFWECFENLACETHPDGFPTGLRFSGAKMSLNAGGDGSAGNGSSGAQFGGYPYRIPRPAEDRYPFEPYNYWWRLVRRYSATKLTHRTDKLVAISGLARRIGALVSEGGGYGGDGGENYVAGLWKSRFVSDLTWMPGQPCVPSSEYIAPSWSWASYDGEILANERYHAEHEPQTKFVEVVGIKVEYETDDRYGRVESGEVRMTGQLFRASIQLTDTTMEKNGFDARWWWMCFEDERLEDMSVKNYGRPVWLEREPELKNGYEVCCLPVLLYDECLYCLLLETTGSAKGEYRRIGIYEAKGQCKEDVGVFVMACENWRLDMELYDNNGTFTIV